MTRRLCGAVVIVLVIGMGVTFAQQPPPAPRGRGEAPQQDPRVRIMQGQGAAIDMTNRAARTPAGMQGETRPMPGVNESRRPGEMISDVDPANCTGCHDRPAIPIGSHDDPGTGFDGESLSRRSWAAWWEVNREPYLRKARAQRESPIQQLTPGSQITEALLRAAQSESPEVRGEAILALGRMRCGTALETMKRLTQNPDQRCALRAWAAIGLLDSPAAREFLATPPAAEGIDRIGWTIAVGLLDEPADSMWDALREQSKDPKAPAEAQRLAIWALRTHHPQGTHELLLDVIKTSTSRESVAEAIVGLPVKSNPGEIRFLADVVAGKGIGELPSLSQFGIEPERITTLGEAYYSVAGEVADPFESEGERLQRNAPARPPAVAFATPFQQRTWPPARPVDARLLETRSTYLFLREAAVRALGEYDVLDADARESVGNPAFFGVQRFRQVFLPQDVLTLGQTGTLEDYYGMSDRVEVNLLWHPGFPEPKPVDRMKRPGRGNAAIAIGLLLERLGGGPQTVPDLVFAQGEIAPRAVSRAALAPAPNAQPRRHEPRPVPTTQCSR